MGTGFVFFLYPVTSLFLTDLIPHSHVLLRPWGIPWLPEMLISAVIGINFLTVAGVKPVLVTKLKIFITFICLCIWASFATFVVWLTLRGGL
jgi:hypothetical protein